MGGGAKEGLFTRNSVTPLCEVNPVLVKKKGSVLVVQEYLAMEREVVFLQRARARVQKRIVRFGRGLACFR